jgi:hypothetical protein
MTRSNSLLALALVSLLVVATAAPVLGNSEFLFYGFSRYLDTPDEVGSVMEVYGILNSATSVPLPLPLDEDNFEYTVVVTDMTVATADLMPNMKSLTYDGGVISIYSDDMGAGGFTAADYGDLSSFSDGDLILVANVDAGWPAILWDFDGDGFFTAGSNGGTADFVGGSMLADLIAAEYYLDDWGFFGSPYADGDPEWIVIPDGFHRIFNVKVTAPNDPTPNQSSTWGQVKALYN